MMDEQIKKAISKGKTSARRVLKIRDEALAERPEPVPDGLPGAEEFLFTSKAFERVGRRTANQVLIAEGDSWFDYPMFDVLGMLEDKHGYEIEDVAHKGDRVEDMAYSDGQLADFNRKVEKLIRRGETPRAILLSGGGNDIAGDEFHVMLNHKDSAAPGINEQVVAGILDERLVLAYVQILTSVDETCRRLLGHHVPIVVHGYGYAVADGRGYLGGWGPLPGPWLEPGFERKGYMAMAARRKIMRALIDRFNTNLIALTQRQPFADFVHFVDLRKALKSGANYKDDWGNELHPSKDGFRRVAKEFDAVINGLPSVL